MAEEPQKRQVALTPVAADSAALERVCLCVGLLLGDTCSKCPLMESSSETLIDGTAFFLSVFRLLLQLKSSSPKCRLHSALHFEGIH